MRREVKGYRGVSHELNWPSFCLVLAVDLPRICLVVTYEVGGWVSFGDFFRWALCLRPCQILSRQIDWMRIEEAAFDCRPRFFCENVVVMYVPMVRNRCLLKDINAR